MKLKFAQLILLFATLSNCQNNSQDRTITNPVMLNDYYIDIKAENVSENNFKTIVKTNFPENTPFTISVSREYTRKNNPEKYSGQIYYAYTSFVKNGVIDFNFTVNDKKWIDEYYQMRKENQLINDRDWADIETLKDSLEINILYTPKANQDKEIKDIIGENGEKMKGDGVENNGNFFTFSKTIKLYNKYKK